MRARTHAGGPPWARGFAGDGPRRRRPAEAPRAGTDLARPGWRAKMMPRPGGVLRRAQVLKESGGARVSTSTRGRCATGTGPCACPMARLTPSSRVRRRGIDVRVALDVIRMAHRAEYDVGVILSQDQDLSEVAEEIRTIAREQNRWIKIACAFPSSPTSRNRRGIDKTDWIRIDRATYDACLDRRDYRRSLPPDLPSDG